MRNVHVRSLLAAVAALALGPSVAAQDRPSAVLSNLEVRQLVERAEPADQARLSAHFTALGDRYAADAKRHISMSRSFGGNPNRNLGSGMSAHCKRLADLDTQAATAVRELATYHQKLASGLPATLPRDAAPFEGGAGAPKPTQKELNALAAKEGTRLEHLALEEYFLTLARRYTAEANEEVALAQVYQGTRIAQAAVHHDRLASLSRDAAKEATEAAEMHKRLADLPR